MGQAHVDFILQDKPASTSLPAVVADSADPTGERHVHFGDEAGGPGLEMASDQPTQEDEASQPSSLPTFQASQPAVSQPASSVPTFEASQAQTASLPTVDALLLPAAASQPAPSLPTFEASQPAASQPSSSLPTFEASQETASQPASSLPTFDASQPAASSPSAEESSPAAGA